MIAALIAFPGDAMPSYWTGKDLFEWCEAFGERTPGKFYDAGQCRGYVSGVADIIVEKKTEAFFTTDEAGPKVNQLMDIVRAYLRDHPEKEICQPTLSSLLH
jgi:hypothetical protein